MLSVGHGSEWKQPFVSFMTFVVKKFQCLITRCTTGTKEEADVEVAAGLLRRRNTATATFLDRGRQDSCIDQTGNGAYYAVKYAEG